ncbi:MAG: glycoside hydrolase family protein, partial [Bacteroidota bacterium]
MKARKITFDLIILLSLFVFTNCSSSKQDNQDKQTIDNTFADSWEFKGVAVEDSGYTIWGSSPIMGEDGKVHIFAARWPGKLKVVPGWRSHSEVAHYIGETPEGPFNFSDISLQGTGEETWDKYAMCNPTIHKVGDKYALLYIANNNPDKPKFPKNQRIGMAISESLYGPWEKVGDDGLILLPSQNKDYWNYKAENGVNNPALLQHPDGGFYLYFKSNNGKFRTMGVAVSEKLEGPYVQMPFPVTVNDRIIEDGYAFMYNDKFALLTTDNHGVIEKGGGILWLSDDGIKFNSYIKGFHRIDD